MRTLGRLVGHARRPPPHAGPPQRGGHRPPWGSATTTTLWRRTTRTTRSTTGSRGSPGRRASSRRRSRASAPPPGASPPSTTPCCGPATWTRRSPWSSPRARPPVWWEDGLRRVWEWSNWATEKDVAALWLAQHGDLFLRVAQPPARDSVYLERVRPQYVTDVRCERGLVKEIRLDVPLADDGAVPAAGPDAGGPLAHRALEQGGRRLPPVGPPQRPGHAAGGPGRPDGRAAPGGVRRGLRALRAGQVRGPG
jgi:hypothetical protein